MGWRSSDFRSQDHRAALFKARTWEELKAMVKENKTYEEAARTMYELSSDEYVREQCRRREEYYRQIRTYEKNLADKDATIADKDAKIAEQSSRIAEQNVQIAEMEAKIAALMARLKESDS